MPSSAILNFTDPYPYQAAIRAAQLEILPSEKGQFRAELTQVTFGRLWMQRGEESLARIFYGATSSRRAAIGFLSDSDQPGYRHNGADVSPGEIIVDDRNVMHRKTVTPCRWGAMSLTPEDLGSAGYALAGRPLMRPSVSMVIRPAPALMSRFLKLHETAGQLAKTAPDLLANPQVARALESALVHAMVMCLTENIPAERSTGTRRRAIIMARFEELLAAHESIPVYIAEICGAIGVTERTFRTCCREQLGMGPIKYLWLRRMNLARRALLQAQPSTSTVTRIAADYGFWEFGRFSVEYRDRFGESPLATLRRPAPSEFA
jgi:AraC-like DNA-binding protein